ncbi:MAG: 3-deoxy-8-phosphooctulonate synthase [Puniceicoccales bacterium]|jgi:2-dehydro-3-deoxyphosphooctonate aldolase (KDO 8-P synthase)|nr:3-deoxy-8-phosphooctulonate synthase [Puniceicoccales bacterium]
MLFDHNKLLIIAGPCVIESEELVIQVADYLQKIQEKFPAVQLIFKASFDKANRSSVRGGRGVGLEEGLAILKGVKDRYGFPLTTDIHWPDQAIRVGEVCDVLQIPAFLCRQTDLLQAAVETGRVVSVKKGQFLSPKEMGYVIEKLTYFGAKEIWPIERGTTFGYNNLVVDMRTFPLLRRMASTVIFDATHSVQLPGAGDGITVGQREFVEHLAYAALAAGANGVFFETHIAPDQAICDAMNQLDVHYFDKIVERCLKFWALRRDYMG